MLWHIRPSVHHTAVYCVKTRECRGMRSSPFASQVSLVFWYQEWLTADDPVQVKFECKEVDPCGNNRAVHILPHNSGTVIDSEKVHLTQIESRPWAFQRAINQGLSVTPNFLKMSFRYPNLSLFIEISTKNHKKSVTKFHCVITSSSIVVAESITYRTVSPFWQGMTPFP